MARAERFRSGAIPEAIARLTQEPLPEGGILSAFLATPPERVPEKDYVIAFEDLYRAKRPHIPEEERARFDKAAARATEILQGEEPGRFGVAVYTSADPDWAFVVALPVRPIERLVWNAKPEIDPLLEAVDEGERTAVLFFDKERARLFVIALGEIEERQGVFDEVPGKQKTGDWFALSQKRYERHHEDHVLRHLHRSLAVLMDELNRRPFDRLFVAGPPEALSMLMHHLPRPLRLRYSGTLELEWFAPDSEILDAALKAAEAAERQHELDLVNRLLDNLNGQVVLGLEPTLAALWERRVDRLFMTNAIKGPGGRCPACGRLVAGSGPCPVCETEVAPVDDLRAAIVEQALASEAKVEFVEGEAAKRLEEHGAIGGWARYTP